MNSCFGLTVSRAKTRHIVTGRLAEKSDREPIEVDGGKIENVEEFPYLGSVVADSGRIDVDVERRIAQASRAFGTLRKAVFQESNFGDKEEGVPGLCAVGAVVWV